MTNATTAAMTNPEGTLPKRTWCYMAVPRLFDVAACECGADEATWSEFEGHCWCPACNKDFVPRHWGILDGPVPTELARRLGMNFDRYNILTDQIEPFDFKTGTYRVADAVADRGHVRGNEEPKETQP